MSVELEIPAVYVDAVLLDDLGTGAGAPFFIVSANDPSNGQIDVSANAYLILVLSTDSGDLPSGTYTEVYISIDGAPEVKVYDETDGFTAGWEGPLSIAQLVSPTDAQIIIDKESPFPSLAEVTVRLTADSSNGQVLDYSYSFTIRDTEGARVIDAQAREKTIVRVTFDAPVNLDAASEVASALNPANYTIARQTVPSADVVVEEVEMVTTSSVDLILDIETTPGARYLLTAANVEDLSGNPIVPPGGEFTFVGFAPRVPEGRDFDLWRMLPQKNRDEDAGDLFKFIRSLQEIADLLLCSVDRWIDIIDPDIAPELFVDAILDDLGNPFAIDLSLNDKRKLIRILVPMYKQKGTGVGIVNAVRFFLGIEVEINAFWSDEGWLLGESEIGETTILGPGDSFGRFSFEIISPVTLTSEQRQIIEEIAEFMKPAHTHLIQIVEPTIPEIPDHWEIGLSELGTESLLH